MRQTSVQKLLLQELQEIKIDIKEVRQHDIPGIRTQMASFQEQLSNVKEKTSSKSMIISGVGGLIAVATSLAIAMFK